MKYIFILICFLFHFSAFSQSLPPWVAPRELTCSKEGTTVMFINGILVAKDSDMWTYVAALKNLKLKQYLDKNKVEYDYSYNSSYGPLYDLIESQAQKLRLEKKTYS